MAGSGSPAWINPNGAVLRRLNAVRTGTVNRYHMPGYRGTLSIKSMVRGSGRWRAGSREYFVDRRHYLILNHDQEYSFTIDTDEPIETFCPFFAPESVIDAVRAQANPLQRLLDDPGGAPAAMPLFFQQHRSHDDRVSPLLRRLQAHARAAPSDELATEGLFHDLLGALLRTRDEDLRAADALRAVKPGTRLELYRRILVVKDYIHANLDRPLNLQQLASVAALSPHHLHRTFLAVIGETPHRYVAARRIERAADLLTATERPVADICRHVGFESVGSFSSLFTRRMGLSPARFRVHRK